MAINLCELRRDLRRSASSEEGITKSTVNNLLKRKSEHSRDLVRI